jgi:hypothetical protein
MEKKYIKALDVKNFDHELYVGDEIKIYGQETTITGFSASYNDGIEKWETIIYTVGRGDPFERSLDVIEILQDQPRSFKERSPLYAAKQAPTGAVWVKADQKPEHNVGVLVFIPGEDNHITSGMWDISNEWVLLDEYRTPDEEVTHWTALPAFPEGYTNNDIPEEWVSTLKAIAKEELAKKGIAKADDWISVDDRLPYRDGDSSVFCLVNDTYEGIVVRPFNEAHVCWDQEDGDDYYCDAKGGKITHWRPLPEAPKG